MDRRALWQEKRDRWARMEAIQAPADTEGRALTEAEQREYDENADRLQAIEAILEQGDRHDSLRSQMSAVQRDPRVAGDGDEERTGIASAEYARSFERYLRHGANQLRTEDREVLRAGMDAELTQNRALSALVGSAGGYLVTPTFLARITQTQEFYGGALQAGPEILTTDGGEDIYWPTNDDTGNTGERLAENGAVSEQAVTFGQRKLGAYLYSSKMVKVPLMLMNDAAFDIEGFLGLRFGERLGRIWNTDLTVGTGASQPQGMVTGATSGVTTASATAITYDELVDLEHSVDPAYRDPDRCRLMLADATLKLLRKLKDGNQRPLWEPSLQAGVPSLFNGYRYVINNDMPAATASNKSVLFGDFGAYYIVRQVTGVLVVRLQELFMQNLQQAFFAVNRMDGGVKDASAVKALTMHA